MRRSDLIAAPRDREVALLLGDTTPEAAQVALARLRAALEPLVEERGGTVALGAVTCTDPMVEPNTVLQRAYQQMYYGRRHPGEVAVAHEVLLPALAAAPA
jgi:GGDEF domain-containing protein